MSKSTVEPVAIFQQTATNASWSSNFYIYYKQIRNKVLSINLLKNNQNTQTILRIGAPNETKSFWSKQGKLLIFCIILPWVKQKKKEKEKKKKRHGLLKLTNSCSKPQIIRHHSQTKSKKALYIQLKITSKIRIIDMHGGNIMKKPKKKSALHNSQSCIFQSHIIHRGLS